MMIGSYQTMFLELLNSCNHDMSIIIVIVYEV